MSNLKVIWSGRKSDSFTIVQGEDLTVSGNVLEESTGLPLDLSAFTTVSASFTDKDSTDESPIAAIVVNGTIDNAVLGAISLPFTDTESARIKSGAQDLLIEFTDGLTLNRRVVAVKAMFGIVSSVS